METSHLQPVYKLVKQVAVYEVPGAGLANWYRNSFSVVTRYIHVRYCCCCDECTYVRCKRRVTRLRKNRVLYASLYSVLQTIQTSGIYSVGQIKKKIHSVLRLFSPQSRMFGVFLQRTRKISNSFCINLHYTLYCVYSFPSKKTWFDISTS